MAPRVDESQRQPSATRSTNERDTQEQPLGTQRRSQPPVPRLRLDACDLSSFSRDPWDDTPEAAVGGRCCRPSDTLVPSSALLCEVELDEAVKLHVPLAMPAQQGHPSTKRKDSARTTPTTKDRLQRARSRRKSRTMPRRAHPVHRVVHRRWGERQGERQRPVG